MARPITYDRNDTLEKAKNIFWQKGYLDTSISDLEKATGLVRTSLYAAFGNKADLYKACLDKYRVENLVWMQTFVSSNDEPIKGLIELFDQLIDMTYADTDKKGCLMVNANQERIHLCKDTLQILEGNKEGILSLYKEELSKAKKDGTLTEAFDIDSAVLALYTLQLGMVTSIKQDIPKEQLKKSMGLMLSKILNTKH